MGYNVNYSRIVFKIYLRDGEFLIYKSNTNITVRYVETDQMGIVHHSNYYIYFEIAREDLIANIGMSYKDMEDLGIMMPIIETQCRYIEGAKYTDKLLIETTVEELSPAKVVLNYTVIRVADNKIIAKGKTMQTFVDKDSFRIINLKRIHPNIYAKLEGLINRQ